MVGTIGGIILCAVVVPLMARGDRLSYRPARLSQARGCAVVGLLVVGLLAVPFAGFDLLWLTGWRSAYLVFGLIVIPLMVWSSGARPAEVGFRLPAKGWPRVTVAGIAALFLAARLAEPLVTGAGYQIDLRTLITNAVIFAIIEEALFRGLMQTRLESALGPAWAWIVTALFFGFYHFYVHYLIPGRAVSPAGALQLLYLTAFGLLLGIVFARSRSLLPSFLIHAANNLSF